MTKKGFTLIELLVVTAMIVILAALLFTNYRSGQKQLALNRSASKLAQDIRRAQEMAMGAEEVNGDVPEGGYGIYLRRQLSPQTLYILFADFPSGDSGDPPNKKCDFGSEEIEKIEFEEGIKIKSLEENHLNIIFTPPDPSILFTDGDGNIFDLAEVSIEVSLEDESKSKTIKVNKAGLINVE